MDYKNILIIVVNVRERFIGLKYNNNENKYPLLKLLLNVFFCAHRMVVFVALKGILYIKKGKYPSIILSDLD